MNTDIYQILTTIAIFIVLKFIITIARKSWFSLKMANLQESQYGWSIVNAMHNGTKMQRTVICGLINRAWDEKIPAEIAAIKIHEAYEQEALR